MSNYERLNKYKIALYAASTAPLILAGSKLLLEIKKSMKNIENSGIKSNASMKMFQKYQSQIYYAIEPENFNEVVKIYQEVIILTKKVKSIIDQYGNLIDTNKVNENNHKKLINTLLLIYDKLKTLLEKSNNSSDEMRKIEFSQSNILQIKKLAVDADIALGDCTTTYMTDDYEDMNDKKIYKLYCEFDNTATKVTDFIIDNFLNINKYVRKCKFELKK